MAANPRPNPTGLSAAAQAINRHSDIALAVAACGIIALMLLNLPHWVIDSLVAINIISGIALLLIAIYIPAAVAFSTFPSVLLVTTLFRLSLSIATTKMILADADAGKIIDTFGHMVARDNLVVGVVVFIIITVVQFIVVAKGAERVAEVAARFTLDAMPGKQLSIDSDLRSGLIDKDEAKRKRKMLELESQLHGNLDGAMKFVKGDSIASIIIVIVNIIGGLIVGTMMKDMPISEALRTYSILTIGEGLVAQIPALFSAFAAGLIVTRTASDDPDNNLGESIGRELFAQPKVFLVSGVFAIALMFVPGFPAYVFAGIAAVGFGIAYMLKPTIMDPLLRKVGIKREPSGEVDASGEAVPIERPVDFKIAPPLLLQIGSDLGQVCSDSELRGRLSSLRENVFADLGVPLPEILLASTSTIPNRAYRLMLFGVPIAEGFIPADYALDPALSANNSRSTLLRLAAPVDVNVQGISQEGNIPTTLGTWVPVAVVAANPERKSLLGVHILLHHLQLTLKRYASQFLGIQEVNQILGRASQQYPDLVKESLRILPLQRISDVMKRLVEEDISIRNVRDILESLAEWGSREKDIVTLTEYVRLGLRRYLSDKYSGSDRFMPVVLLHPELEDQFRNALQMTNTGTVLALEPQIARRVIGMLRTALEQTATHGNRLTLLTAMDIRRYVRKLIETEFPSLPVLSYGEIETDIRVEPAAHINI